ncbi:GNAT family N-acetyltransferase [Pararhodobacter oceanensis]|uniref:GNAT family N-acetyltransferase n=1 Tax=Pararhodobacter oceanensis TaxID=2172121 RepID=UPI003A947E8A
MSIHPDQSAPELRKLWRRDHIEITRHFLRLDADSRQLRFGMPVNDAFIKSYVDGLSGEGTLLVGGFFDGELRAVGELRGLTQAKTVGAELALSVERDWQGRGLGSAVFARLVTAAQNRGVTSLYVLYLHENRRIQRIVAKHNAKFRAEGSQIEASFRPAWATPLSVAREIGGDIAAYSKRMFRALGARSTPQRRAPQG